MKMIYSSSMPMQQLPIKNRIQQPIKISIIFTKKKKITRKNKRKIKNIIQNDKSESKTSLEYINEAYKYLLPIYANNPIVLKQGKGSRIFDLDNKEYLDFTGGIAVNALGHVNEKWIQAIDEQKGKICHSSNLFYTIPPIKLAQRLVENSFGDKVMFLNSGTEANEAALKFARKWSQENYNEEKNKPYEIVSFTEGFHGRTMGSLSLTFKDKFKKPFEPMLPGNVIAEFNNLESADEKIIPGKTCAVIIEPIQGEGGINIATKEFLKGLREICDKKNCLLIFDEIQCGMGRTGKLWAYQNYDVIPDMMTLAKPLAGGIPIGAIILNNKVVETISKGDHGTTFGGNALACHVACTVFDIINDPEFLNEIQIKSEYFKNKLRKELKEFDRVIEIRGYGLLIGIECKEAVNDIIEASMDLGLLLLTAGDGNIIRILPPLNATEQEIDECSRILKLAFKQCNKKQKV